MVRHHQTRRQPTSFPARRRLCLLDLRAANIVRFMPKYRVEEASSADLTFRPLGDSSRRAMLERLSRGPASVTELARPFGMALPSAMQHLRMLEDAQIVVSSKIGRVRSYQLIPGA